MIDLKLIVAQVVYNRPGWKLMLRYDDQRPYVQVVDAEEGWSGRKWMLSQHMTETEVVNTCWLAIERAEIHEAAERFTYRGLRVFDPHRSIHAALEAAEGGRIEVRANAMQGAK